MKALVAGGAGFLGSLLGERLEARGNEVYVPRGADADLRQRDDAARLFEQVRPEVILRLASKVGGIDANRSSPGRYW